MLHSTHIDLKNKSLSELHALLRQAFNAAAATHPGSRMRRDAEAIKHDLEKEIAYRTLESHRFGGPS